MKNNIKILLFALFTIIIILGSGMIIKRYLKNTTNQFLDLIQNTENSLNTGDWASAYHSINEIDDKWTITENTWAMFTNHHEIDNITVKIKDTKEFIRGQDPVQSKASLLSLRHYLSHIPEMENLSLKNVL
jgi:hypothetical protein